MAIKYVDNTIAPASTTTYDPATRSATGGTAACWRSIQGALNAGLAAGDTLYIRGGTVYAEGVVDSTSFGSSGSPILIAGYPTDTRPIIRPPSDYAQVLAWWVQFEITRTQRWLTLRYLDIDAINLPDNTAGLRFEAPRCTAEDVIVRNTARNGVDLFSRWLTLRDCSLRDGGRIQPGDQADTKGLGFYSSPDVPNDAGLGTPIGGDILVEDCLIEGFRGGGGVIHYGDGSNHNNIVIQRCTFRNFGDYSPWTINGGGWPAGTYEKSATGINVGGAGIRNGNVGPRNVTIKNCLFYNIGAPGIAQGHNVWGADDVKIFNNTYHNVVNGTTPADAWAYRLLCNSTNTNFQLRNLIWSQIQTETNFFEPDMGCGVTFTRTLSNNLWNPNAANTFVNAGAGNFHLKSGSPAIDAGQDLSASGVVDDRDKVARPL